MNFQFIEINSKVDGWDEITLKMFYNWVQDLYDEPKMMDLEAPAWGSRLPTAKQAAEEIENLQAHGIDTTYK